MHPIAHAQARPDHPAIIMAGSGETVSYRAMDETANRFARLLQARGVGRGAHFGLLMENNALYLQLVWGSQRSGAMMVPISTRLTAPEIAYILNDSDARLLVTSARFADRIEALRALCPQCAFMVLDGEGEEDLAEALAAQSDAPLDDPMPGQYML